VGLRLKIAKHSRRKFSAGTLAVAADQTVRTEGAPVSVENISLSADQLTADNTRDVASERNQRLSLARFRANGNQSKTSSFKSGKQTVGNSSKPADKERKKKGENLAGKKVIAEKRHGDDDNYGHVGSNSDRQSGKRLDTAMKEKVYTYTSRSVTVKKGYKKTQKHGKQTAEADRCNVSDVSSGSLLWDKPPAQTVEEQKCTGNGGDQIVPPLRIHLDQQRSQSADQKAETTTSEHSVNISGGVISSGPQNPKDDADVHVHEGATEKIFETKPTESAALIMHVAANNGKTEEDTLQRKDDAASQSTISDQWKDGTSVQSTSSDQRRTRLTSGGATVRRTGPVVTKRRLSFEESLIAGTCICITPTNLTAEVSKTSTTSETVHSVKQSASKMSAAYNGNLSSKESLLPTATKLTFDSKPVLNVLTKKDHNIVTKRVRLDDEKSLSMTSGGAKKASDEVTSSSVKLRSSHPTTSTEDSSSNVKISSSFAAASVDQHSQTNSVETKSALSSQAAPLGKDPQFNPKAASAAVHSKIIECDPVSRGDGKPKGMRSDNAGTSTSEDKSTLSEGDSQKSQMSAKHSLSERKRGHSRRNHHQLHSSSNVNPHRMTGSSLDYELRQRSRHDNSRRGNHHGNNKFDSLIHVETQPNGGASVVHAYDDQLSALSLRELGEFVREFFRVVFDEEPVGVPHHVMGIVHGSASFLPDILEYFAAAHPDIVVKRGHLGKPLDMETTTIWEYHRLVHSTYLAGTYRTGPLDHFSIVGTRAEETGGFFPEFLDLLDQNVFLRAVSPWGRMSELENMPRDKSNDGPIIWARPGEQVVPTADMPKSPSVKKR